MFWSRSNNFFTFRCLLLLRLFLSVLFVRLGLLALGLGCLASATASAPSFSSAAPSATSGTTGTTGTTASSAATASGRGWRVVVGAAALGRCGACKWMVMF